ncbi:hypothetical protein [Roseivirga thermotolerans]|uniref:hypothetical protein n=2 Tax=Roseivirga thermotolerans TaxID=1758176 RepID=UPI00273DA92D|nr:hypothetical protein [Roseivirga thermotolerans]
MHLSTLASESIGGANNVMEATIEHRARLDWFMSLSIKIRFSYKDGKFVELKNITSSLTGIRFGFQSKQVDYGHYFNSEKTILYWSMSGNLALAIGSGGWGTISESSRSFNGEISITNLSGGQPPHESITNVHHY